MRNQLTADERGDFDVAEFAQEFSVASDNHEIGTALWLENDHVKVFESKLEPGKRAPFHVHDRTYFWTVVDAGRGLQRFADGTYVVHDYEVGESKYLQHSPDAPLIHDLENVGDTTLRFITVELKH
jgi:mannose-6-phosphate isomerase-like protein (cupin superfamily)